MAIEKVPVGSSVAEVLERVLDKGIVIDAAVRVSVIGIELLRVDAWVVVASIETYLGHDDLMRRIVQGDDEVPPLIVPELDA
jgi:gas vesicle structural protein